MRGVDPARIWLVAVCILELPLSVRAEDERELLALVKAGHRSAQESIHTLSCTVSHEADVPKHTLLKTGKYFRSGSVARIQDEQPTGTVDHFYLERESEVREVVRNRPGTGQPAWAVGRRRCTELAHPLDVWRLMFLEFDLLLPTAKNTPRVKREKFAGRTCVRVTIDILTETEVTFWFDVGRNYLLWKRDWVGKSHRNESEILEFVEPEPGMYFPTKLGAKSFRGREQDNQGFVTLSEVRINEPVAKDLLKLPAVPRGTICNDWIKKEKYPIDENWQQLAGSRAEPLELYALPAASSAPGGSFTAQSTTAAKPWTRWIAPASLVVLVFACGALVYRQYRAQSRESV